MFDLDEKKLKCALTLAILFFVLSHPYLYKVCHNTFSATVSFLDGNGCPTEIGVFVMAIVFTIVVYNGYQYFSVNGVKKNNKGNGNGNNALLGKCRTYCEQVSQEMNQENAIMNNIANTNNNQMANNNRQMANNNRQMANNNRQVANNQMANNQMANNQMANNQMANNQMANNNNQVVANNIQVNQNRMNNSMMNNQLQNNVASAPMPSVNLNNSNNLGMDNLNNTNTGSSDMGLLNSQSCSDNPQCSGNMNSLSGQGYDQNQGGMFTENTTYHDDMYASLF